MKSKLFLYSSCLSVLLFGTTLVSVAQTRSLPILDAPADARAAAMGGATLMSTDRSYLYVNPASILNQDAKMTISASGVMYPKHDQSIGRLKNGLVSAGWRFHDQHVVYAGFRYQGGIKYLISSGQFDSQDALQYNPFDWTIDMGYAYKINQNFIAFATGSFIQSYTGRAAYGGSFSIGANYLTDVKMGGTNSQLSVAARVIDFGTSLNFTKDERYYLPTRAELTADLTTLFSENHKLTALVGAKYYFLLATSQLFQGNLGAEYTLYNIASLRAGLQLGSHNTNYWTCGLGAQYMGAKIDFAYLGGFNNKYSNKLMLTLSYNY